MYCNKPCLNQYVSLNENTAIVFLSCLHVRKEQLLKRPILKHLYVSLCCDPESHSIFFWNFSAMTAAPFMPWLGKLGR